MLSTLRIENIAVIERAEIEFSSGLNVLTGETGAGKSIVIDSIGAVIGARTSKDVVRNGTSGACVTAIFDNIGSGVISILAENDIEAEDGQLIIKRKISPDGKNNCRINGVPVTVAQLRAVGLQLVDIHGQSEAQRLLDESSHLYYLDSFAEADELLDDYKRAYSLFCETERKLKELEISEEEKDYKSELLRHRIAELESAKLREDEEEPMLQRCAILRNAEKLQALIDRAYECIYGGDDSEGAFLLIGEAQDCVETASKVNCKFAELAEEMNNLKFAADDVSERLRDLRAELDFTPGELDEIETRLSLLNRLQKKYSKSIGELIDLLEDSKEQLNKIEFTDHLVEQLTTELDARRKEAYNSAQRLSKYRHEAAEEMSKKIMAQLKELSMPSVRFDVSFTEKELGESGIDTVRFIMSANAGQELGRISKIASGGELSRIMLAMKNVIAEHDAVNTMIFDEVDSGVSGVAAQRVGEKLSDLARSKQVICVTHLPQLAALADEQYIIEKAVQEGKTYTTVRALDESGRESEIARITGGENITITTLTSAREQLEAAKAYKERNREK